MDLSFPIFMDTIKVISKRTDFRPHHFILMNNHYHLIGSTPQANLYKFMQIFQTTVSQAINNATNRTNHIFGSRYGATIVMSEYHLTNVIRYLYQNPVRANITNDPLRYPYSSLKYYLTSEWPHYGFYMDSYLENLSERSRLKNLEELCKAKLIENEYLCIKKNLRKKFF